MFPSVVETFRTIKENIGGSCFDDSVTLARGHLDHILSFDFILTLIVVKNILRYIRPLTIKLQEKKTDLSKTFMQVNLIKEQLNKMRVNIDNVHQKYFDSACELARKYDVPIKGGG